MIRSIQCIINPMLMTSLVEAIHRAPGQGVLALTGGGAGFAAMLMNVPGASRTVLEVTIPYAEAALSEYLGYRPEQYCSPETATALADRAWERAAELTSSEAVFGVGCTASLAPTGLSARLRRRGTRLRVGPVPGSRVRPKRGDHRFHLCVHTPDYRYTSSLRLEKGQRSRAEEEEVLDLTLLNLLAEALGLPERVSPAYRASETPTILAEPWTDEIDRLLRGEVEWICQEPDGRLRTNGPLPEVLLSGSFHPLHTAHRRLAEIAEHRLGKPVAYELSIQNVDKPTLSAVEVRRRARQFRGFRPLWITRAATFVEKMAIFPGVDMVMGADTAIRLVDPRYYDHDERRRDQALTRLHQSGSRILVAGRADGTGRFISAESLGAFRHYEGLFLEVTEEEFRVDLSSTQLRQQ